jgi:hypothetical protein
LIAAEVVNTASMRQLSCVADGRDRDGNIHSRMDSSKDDAMVREMLGRRYAELP